jgi:DNA (cytosine-5)-methyltransferase 1
LTTAPAPTAATSSRPEYPDALEQAWRDHLAPKPADAPTVISTFAGCGGSSLGYSMAGFRELLAVEWDNHAAAQFRENFPEVPLFHGDIAALTVEKALALSGLKPGELDVFDGSPPCQGFSTSGKRMLDDPRNQLFREYIRLLEGLRPKAFVMENVSGMVKGKMRLIFAEILRTLKESGYHVRARLMNAMYYGVPQARERMIFIGTRADLPIAPSHPAPLGQPYTVRDAWRGLEHTPGITPNVKAMPYASRAKPGGSASRFHPLHHYFNLNRLAWNKPSRTITKVTSGRGMLLHPDLDESISIAEAKRIGSFPDAFTLSGTHINQWARIGNSVPPLLMRAIASHIKTTILHGG